MYHDILVPLDGSAFAEQALSHAQYLAVPGQSTIHLVSVAPMLEDAALAVVDLYPIYVYRDYMIDQEQEMRRVEEELAGYLDQVSQRLQAEGHKVESCVRSGQPAEQILACTRERNCDLIVMSTHGRSGLGRWVYGSVADKVLRGSDTPVLLIRVVETQS